MLRVSEKAKGEDSLPVEMDCCDQAKFVAANIEYINIVAAPGSNRIGAWKSAADLDQVFPTRGQHDLAPGI